MDKKAKSLAEWLSALESELTLVKHEDGENGQRIGSLNRLIAYAKARLKDEKRPGLDVRGARERSRR